MSKSSLPCSSFKSITFDEHLPAFRFLAINVAICGLHCLVVFFVGIVGVDNGGVNDLPVAPSVPLFAPVLWGW